MSTVPAKTGIVVCTSNREMPAIERVLIRCLLSTQMAAAAVKKVPNPTPANTPEWPKLPAQADIKTRMPKETVVWSFRNNTRTQYDHDGVFALLPYRSCPACKSPPAEVGCDCSEGCHRSGLYVHVEKYGHCILKCGNPAADHYWWPSENKAYTQKEAIDREWLIPHEGFVYGVCDTTMFLKGSGSL